MLSVAALAGSPPFVLESVEHGGQGLGNRCQRVGEGLEGGAVGIFQGRVAEASAVDRIERLALRGELGQVHCAVVLPLMPKHVEGRLHDLARVLRQAVEGGDAVRVGGVGASGDQLGEIARLAAQRLRQAVLQRAEGLRPQVGEAQGGDASGFRQRQFQCGEFALVVCLYGCGGLLLQEFQRVLCRQGRQHGVRRELHFAGVAVRADGQRMRQRLQAVAVEQKTAQAEEGENRGAETAEVGGTFAVGSGEPEVQYRFVVDVEPGELVSCLLLQELGDGAELALRLRRGKVVAQRSVELAGEVLGDLGDGLAGSVLRA